MWNSGYSHWGPPGGQCQETVQELATAHIRQLMASHESEREDLLREATALIERAEFLLAEAAEPVVIGFRASGAASVFCGGDPVYHFTSAGELRRAYAGGKLYKAENRRLIELHRQRTVSAVQLLRRELSQEESDRFVQQAQARLQAIDRQLRDGKWKLCGKFPPQGDVVGRTQAWLAELPKRLNIAQTPNVR